MSLGKQRSNPEARLRSPPSRAARALRRIGWLSIAWVLAVACTPVTSAPGVGFACTVDWETLIKGSMRAPDVCARFKDRLERQLGRTMDTAAVGSDNYPERLIVTVRFARSGTASARLTRLRGAEATAFPQVNVSLSDRPFDAATVDVLADQLARQLPARAD